MTRWTERLVVRDSSYNHVIIHLVLHKMNSNANAEVYGKLTYRLNGQVTGSVG